MIFRFVIQSLLCSCSFVIELMLFSHFLLERKVSLQTLILKIMVVIVCSVGLAGINLLESFWLNVLVSFIISFLLVLSFYKGKLLIKFSLAILIITLAIFFEFFVVILASWVFGESLTMVIEIPSAKIAMTIISKVLLFIVVRVILLFTKGRKYVKTGLESSFLITLPIATIANIFLIVKLEFYVPPNNSQKIFMVLVCFGLILCNIAIFFIYDRNIRKYELENKLHEAEELQRIQASYYMQIEKRLKESRKQLHDFKNHITTLEHFNHINSNQALDYMHGLQDQLNHQMDLVNFGVHNTAFDVIIHEHAKICMDYGITFESNILYHDLSILNYIDTCTIFANALDHAIKACSEITNGEKHIVLEIKYCKDGLSIIIENTKQTKIVKNQESFVTTKKEKSKHDFGIETIKKAVSNYHGFVHITDTENTFTLAIIIPIPYTTLV